MRNSLIFKLMGAFLFVIAIGALVIALFTSQATQNAFSLYTSRSGQAIAQRLAPTLADYFASTGSWQGVDALLRADFGGGNMMGQGQGRGMGAMMQQAAGAGMMSASGQRLILVNDQGSVVSDTQNELTGKQIPVSQIKNGVPVSVNNRTVGTLIVTPSDLTTAGTPAGEFIASVNQALVTAVIIAGIIALMLGAVLFFQITAPLRQLKKAAAAIGSGDLSQRVSVRSKDEIGEVGQSFNQMAENLAKAEVQRQHLAADVAHELRTPLTAIQGTLEAILDGVLPFDEEQAAALHAETLLLNRLVGDLRLLSLAEAGQLKLELQEVDSAALIQNIAERAKPQAASKNIRLETSLQPDLPEVSIDSDRITQVLNNLISNAMRYTPEGGTITVTAAMAPSGDAIQVSVTDNGPGVNPLDLPYVFDRFYRADKSRARASGGSGLGLAIVRQLVEAHNGSVSAESPVFSAPDQAGYGTKISFLLPAPLRHGLMHREK